MKTADHILAEPRVKHIVDEIHRNTNVPAGPSVVDLRCKHIIDLIHRGKNVPIGYLAYLVLDGRPLSLDVRRYIAGRITGKIKPKGRPATLPRLVDDGRGGRVALDTKKGIELLAAIFLRERLITEYPRSHAAARDLKKDQRAYDRECERLWRLKQSPRKASPSELAYAFLAERHGERYHTVRTSIKRASIK